MTTTTLHGNVPQLLGPTLRRMRKEHGWTLQEVAIRVGMSVSNLSEIERGIANPTWSRLQEICAALGYKISLEFEECRFNLPVEISPPPKPRHEPASPR